jgi:hypothetical protein
MFVKQPPHHEWRKQAIGRAAARERQGGNGCIVGGRGLGINGRRKRCGGGRAATAVLPIRHGCCCDDVLICEEKVQRQKNLFNL